MKRDKWTIGQFKEYCRDRLRKQKHTASMLVLKSFYISDVEKPKHITARLFDYLRSIADQQVKKAIEKL